MGESLSKYRMPYLKQEEPSMDVSLHLKFIEPCKKVMLDMVGFGIIFYLF